MEKWARDWIEEQGEIPEDVIKWMVSRPDSVKELMRRLPPGCLVRALRPLHTPAPTTVGFVYSYTEDGKVTVLQNPLSVINAYCQPDWLEPVGFRLGLTPEKVAEILD